MNKFNKVFHAVLIAENSKGNNVKVVKWRKTMSGVYYRALNTIECPLPKSSTSLYVALHEIGHSTLKPITPRYVEEYEASIWAFKKMREYGIRVSHGLVKKAKKHLIWRINMAKRRGLKKPIDKKVLSWIK